MQEQLPLPGTETPQDKLAVLLQLAKRLEEGHVTIQEAEKAVAELKEFNKQLEEAMLPDMMLTLGLTEITLTSGRKITVVREYYPSITKERSEAAMKWLREHNMGGIIKRQFIVGPDAEAALTTANIPFEKKEAIHPNTLKSLVKEQMELPNSTFPGETFGVFVLTKAAVKEAK